MTRSADEQIRDFAHAAGVSADQMASFLHALQEMSRASERAIIYTNRAGHRARARAEKRTR